MNINNLVDTVEDVTKTMIIITADMEETVYENIVVDKVEEDTQVEPIDKYKNTEVKEHQVNVVGKSSASILMVSMRILVANLRHQQMCTRTRQPLQICWETTRITSFDTGEQWS